MDLKNKTSGIYLTGLIWLCVLNFVVRLFFLGLPANFDEVGYFDGVRVIYENNFNPIVSFIGYKPPVVFEPVVLLWKMFGPSMMWGKLFIFLMSSLALFYTYLLGKKIANEKVGLMAAIILCFFPLFLTQSFLYQDAVPLTAIFTMTIYYFFTKKYWPYFICASLLVLTKETMVFIPAILFLFEFFNDNFSLRGAVKSVKFLLPLACFAIWTCLNKIFLGWFLLPDHVGWFKIQNIFSQGFHDFFAEVWVDNFMWLVLSIILAGFLFLNKTREKQQKVKADAFILFPIIILLYFFLLSMYSTSHRYFLFVYPMVFVLAGNFIDMFFKKMMAWLVVLVLVFFMIISNIFVLLCTPWFNDGDRDLRLFSNIYLNRQTIAYVENNYDNPLIVTTWPLDVFFGDDFYGYATKKHDYFTVDCRFPDSDRLMDLQNSFAGRDIVLINPRNICSSGFGGDNMDLVKIISWTPYGYEHMPIEIYKLRNLN